MSHFIKLEYRNDRATAKKMPDFADLLTGEIPGITKKLVDGTPLNAEEFGYYERQAKACENAILPLIEGIGAIGQLMTAAAQSPEGLYDETAVHIGFLLKALSDQISWMNDHHDNARSIIARLAPFEMVKGTDI